MFKMVINFAIRVLFGPFL